MWVPLLLTKNGLHIRRSENYSQIYSVEHTPADHVSQIGYVGQKVSLSTTATVLAAPHWRCQTIVSTPALPPQPPTGHINSPARNWKLTTLSGNGLWSILEKKLPEIDWTVFFLVESWRPFKFLNSHWLSGWRYTDFEFKSSFLSLWYICLPEGQEASGILGTCKWCIALPSLSRTSP